MLCSKNVGRQGRRGEEIQLYDNFLGIYDFGKINCEAPEYFSLPTLASPGRALPILPFGQKSGGDTCLLPDDGLEVWV